MGIEHEIHDLTHRWRFELGKDAYADWLFRQTPARLRAAGPAALAKGMLAHWRASVAEQGPEADAHVAAAAARVWAFCAAAGWNVEFVHDGYAWPDEARYRWPRTGTVYAGEQVDEPAEMLRALWAANDGTRRQLATLLNAGHAVAALAAEAITDATLQANARRALDAIARFAAAPSAATRQALGDQYEGRGLRLSGPINSGDDHAAYPTMLLVSVAWGFAHDAAWARTSRGMREDYTKLASYAVRAGIPYPAEAPHDPERFARVAAAIRASAAVADGPDGDGRDDNSVDADPSPCPEEDRAESTDLHNPHGDEPS